MTKHQQIRNTDPDPRHHSWRDRRSGRFVSLASVQVAKSRALGELAFAMVRETAYGPWPAVLAGADLQDLACDLALQGLPVALGVQPAKRAPRQRVARDVVAWSAPLRINPRRSA